MSSILFDAVSKSFGAGQVKALDDVDLAIADKVAALQKDPSALKGQKLLLTTNSTADYAARNCLAKWGL